MYSKLTKNQRQARARLFGVLLNAGTAGGIDWSSISPEDFLYSEAQEYLRKNPPPKDASDLAKISWKEAPLDYYLFYGVENLTDEERLLRLEQAYYDRLVEIGAEAGAEKAKDYLDRIKAGQELPGEVMSKLHEEMLAPELQKLAMESAEQNYLHSLRLGTLSAYNDEMRMMKRDHAEAIPALYDSYDRWRLNPEITKVLSERKGYSGQYYSYFFGLEDNTRELDLRFYNAMKAGIESGMTRSEIIDLATSMCTGEHLNRARIKNVVMTETTRAFQEGAVIQHKKTGYIVAYRFKSVKDGREWEGCRYRHDLIIAADDPLLAENTPPLHYFCRSTLQPLSARRLEQLGGQARLKADRDKWLTAPKFAWHYTPDKGIFREADIPD